MIYMIYPQNADICYACMRKENQYYLFYWSLANSEKLSVIMKCVEYGL
jgi:predicted Fe-S protein YdhL (DUF1289 family)